MRDPFEGDSWWTFTPRENAWMIFWWIVYAAIAAVVLLT
jgi:hypothetical protein